MRPDDMFPPHVAERICEDDGNDDCWLWTGTYQERSRGMHPYYEGKSVRRMASELTEFKGLRASDLVMACEKDLCVQPEHVTHPSTDPGRLLYIKHRSKPQGDCLIWTGTVQKGYPRFPLIKNGRQVTASVQRFIYEQEHGVYDLTGGQIELICGNWLCVHHQHITALLRPADGLCSQGHMLQPHGLTCSSCARQEQTNSSCQRGHRWDAHEAPHAAKVGCWECRAEDAEAYIRQRKRLASDEVQGSQGE